ncbi:adenylate/guanylate cyclase domain-containing protein [Terrarubrum flagellatum]|uniref:adenylate/guanylate cyclase domain-containing protein n=1 Tax=Terrirubrum flagellatum TaxID=2895980 RepID=UPI003144FC3E
MQRPQRKLTAMVSVDVADSSRRMQDNESETLRELARIRKQVAGPLLRKFRGDMFKTMGDGGLIEFMSVEDAVCFTLEFQEAMARRNGGAANPIRFRAGIALADVLVEGDDRFGWAIGFLVHLQQIAPPGGVVLTHSVRWQLAKSVAARFTRAETRRIKGVDELMEVWIHAPDGMPDSVQPPSSPLSTPIIVPRRCSADKPVLVILPFSNLTGDPARAALIDGVVDELTRSLAHAAEFSVMAADGALGRAGGAIDPRFLAMEVGARYVLSGALRASGERVRVGVQLIEAHTRAVLWSDRFEGELDDVFALEDHIATSIAGALHTVVRSAEIARAERKGTAQLTPQDHIHRAMPRFWAHRREDNDAAIAELNAALEAAPRHALALALKGWCLSQKVTYIWSEDIARDKAEALRCADQAAALDSDDAMALTAIGATYTILEVSQTRALSFINRALARDPHLAWAWLRAGYAHAYNGDPREGVRCLEQALALSPFDPIKFNIFAGLGVCHFLLANYSEAEECAARALEHKPGMVWANRLLATSAAHAGDLAVARQAVEGLLGETSGLTVEDVGDAIHNLAGRDLERYLDGLRMAGLPERAPRRSNVLSFDQRRRERGKAAVH